MELARRLAAFAGEQAIDLFLQTVSMKTVGDLTSFVRSHMLEPFPVEARIKDMIRHFDDLTRAHGEVVKARELSGASGLLFRRNSQSGAIEVVPRTGTWGGLNAALHANQ